MLNQDSQYICVVISCRFQLCKVKSKAQIACELYYRKQGIDVFLISPWVLIRIAFSFSRLSWFSLFIQSNLMTFIQRRINVDATSWRCIDVDATLHKHHLPAGSHFSQFLLSQTAVITNQTLWSLEITRMNWICIRFRFGRSVSMWNKTDCLTIPMVDICPVNLIIDY